MDDPALPDRAADLRAADLRAADALEAYDAYLVQHFPVSAVSTPGHAPLIEHMRSAVRRLRADDRGDGGEGRAATETKLAEARDSLRATALLLDGDAEAELWRWADVIDAALTRSGKDG